MAKLLVNLMIGVNSFYGFNKIMHSFIKPAVHTELIMEFQVS